MEINEIILASHNDNKVAEINAMLLDSNISIKSLKEIDYHTEIIENGETLEENAFIKARTIYNLLNKNVIGEDTGLEVESLNNMPGVHTARYSGEDRNPIANMDKLLADLSGVKNRSAKFKTVIALVLQGKEYKVEGIVNGSIAYEKAGEGGFGYDPIFIPQGYTKTFAELPDSVKNEISHRSRAIKALVNLLKDLQS